MVIIKIYSKIRELQNKRGARIVLYWIFSVSLGIWLDSSEIRKFISIEVGVGFCILVLGTPNTDRVSQISHLVYQRIGRCVSNSGDCSNPSFEVEVYVTVYG